MGSGPHQGCHSSELSYWHCPQDSVPSASALRIYPSQQGINALGNNRWQFCHCTRGFLTDRQFTSFQPSTGAAFKSWQTTEPLSVHRWRVYGFQLRWPGLDQGPTGPRPPKLLWISLEETVWAQLNFTQKTFAQPYLSEPLLCYSEIEGDNGYFVSER